MSRGNQHTRPKRKQLYVAFYKPSVKAMLRHPFDLLICLFTWSRISHVEIVTGDTNHWSELQWRSSSPRNGGMRRRQLAPREGHWLFVQLGRVASSDIGKAEAWFDDRLGTKYDWLGAVTCLFGGFLNNTRRWFCSEAVLDSLKHIGVIPTSGSRPSAEVSPARLHAMLVVWLPLMSTCTARACSAQEVGGMPIDTQSLGRHQ